MNQVVSERGVSSRALFSAKGRIGRTRYVLYLSAYYLAVQIAALVPPLNLVVLVAALVSYCFVTTQRIHDIGLAGWYTLILGIPVVNLILVFIPGSKRSNRFGEPPTSPSTKEAAAAGVAGAATIALLIATYLLVVKPAFNAYFTRNAIATVEWVRTSHDIPIERIDFTSPQQVRVSVDGFGTVEGVYDTVSSTVFLEIEVEDAVYLLELIYDPTANRLAYVEEGDVVGFLEPIG